MHGHVTAKGREGWNLVVDGALFGVAALAGCNGLAKWPQKSAA
jgi:hypothetical protein